MQKATSDTQNLLTTIADLTPEQRAEKLRSLAAHYQTAIQKGQDKVGGLIQMGMAVTMYDLVDKHILRLDDDLAKFEEEQLTGPKLVIEPKYYQSEKKDETPHKRRRQEVEDSPSSRRQRKPVIKPKRCVNLT